MDKRLKIFFSVVLVCAVAFFVARVFWPKPSPYKPPAKKVVVKKKAAPAAKKTPAPAAEAARMAIILDDWGMNASLLDDAVAVDRPLTLSVLPNLKHSRDIAESAHAAGLGVMLHMPMQAKSLKAPREPHTIMTTSSDAQILEYLDEALQSVPHAEGVNNHQGSAATSDARVMRTALSHLKKKGLFFVDSKVIATSVGSKMAAETGIDFATRDVFIDNVPAIDAIKTQLREAARQALKKGRAVVIGHDKKATLQAIREMVPEIEKSGVKIVSIKELL